MPYGETLKVLKPQTIHLGRITSTLAPICKDRGGFVLYPERLDVPHILKTSQRSPGIAKNESKISVTLALLVQKF